MTAATPVIPRGGRAAAVKAHEEAEARKQASKQSFNVWRMLNLKGPQPGEGLEGESIVVRLTTDEPDFREVQQHSFIDTKPAPKDMPQGRKWPAKMGAVCRQSPGFDAIYDDCYIDDNVVKTGDNGKTYPAKPSLRLWATAVEREEILGTQEMADAGEIEAFQVGDVVGYKDKTQERTLFDENNKPLPDKVTEKVWLVLNFGLDNFFDKLIGFATSYKTVLDRDYLITRVGTGTDTDYRISPLDKIQVEVDGKQVTFDLRNPIFAKDYEPPFDLDEIIAEQASDRHYEWFFDKRVESSWEERFGKADGDKTERPAKAESPAESSGESRQTLDAIRARVEANRAKTPK